MDNDEAQRSMEFSRLAVWKFKIEGGSRKTHWADKIYQLLHDGGKKDEAQKAYDRIMSKPLGLRGYEAQ